MDLAFSGMFPGDTRSTKLYVVIFQTRGSRVHWWTGGRLNGRIVALILGVAFVSAAADAHGQGRSGGIPRPRKQGTATQLLVDGAPFLILGGELGNSSASSREYLRPMPPAPSAPARTRVKLYRYR